jgi:hypothetical protein
MLKRGAIGPKYRLYLGISWCAIRVVVLAYTKVSVNTKVQ